MTKESLIELQKIDANCNDCKHMARDMERYNAANSLYTDKRGTVSHPSHRAHYGTCGKFNKAVSFIPNTCQLDTQDCFEHRRESNF